MEKETKNILAVDEMEQAAREFKEEKYKYEAFISYRHLEPDASIAQGIHKMIETFKVPKEFYTNGVRPSFRVFRDREELVAKDLTDSIEDALENSKFLIVICSKRTPLSEWCVKEIETFRKLHGDSRIIPVLVEGEPQESFPQPLKELKRGSSEEGEIQDVLAVELRPKEVQESGFIGYEALEKEDPQKHKSLTKESLNILKTEKYRLMATILGCAYGDLKQRDKERKNKLIMTISSIVAAALMVFGVFMTSAYQRAEKARREAVQSNTAILLKSSRDMLNEGDTIKSILVAKEAMKPIDPSMENYGEFKSEVQGIFNNSIYHNGAAMLTTIPTKNKLTYFSISKDGKYLAFGYGNNETAIYNPENGALIKILKGHSEQVKIVSFSPKDNLLASSSFDNNTIIFDPNSGEEINRILQEGIPMMTQFSKSGEKLFIATLQNSGINFSSYNSENWNKEGEVIITDPVKFADVKGNGEELIVVLEKPGENQLTIRSMKTGEIIKSYEAPKYNTHPSEGEGVALAKDFTWAKYSLDGESILANASGELVKINISNGNYSFKENPKVDLENSIIVEGKEGKKIYFKLLNNINIIDGQDGKSIEKIYFDNIKVKNFDFHEESNTIVVSGENGLLGIWKDGAIVEQNLSYGRGVPTEIRFTPDGSKVITSAHENQVIKIIDTNPKLIEKPIDAQLVAVSNDSSNVLFYNGEKFLIWQGKGSELEELNISSEGLTNYISEIRNYRISNDGRYVARILNQVDDQTFESKKIIYIDDVIDKKTYEIPLDSIQLGFAFTSDSNGIYVMDEINGTRVVDIKTGKETVSFPEVRSNSYKFLVSEDGNSFVINRLSGMAEIYDSKTGEQIGKVPGEVLYLNGTEDELRAKGIYNNSGFIWTKKGVEMFDLDEYCAETPVSFGDVNIFNEKENRLLMIRNNESDNNRISYLVDFSTGKLMMSFKSSLNTYRINGYISPDGNTIAMDQYYYMNYNSETQEQPISYRATAIYEILKEEEMMKEVENIVSGRELTPEEKEQIGIKSN